MMFMLNTMLFSDQIEFFIVEYEALNLFIGMKSQLFDFLDKFLTLLLVGLLELNHFLVSFINRTLLMLDAYGVLDSLGLFSVNPFIHKFHLIINVAVVLLDLNV